MIRNSIAELARVVEFVDQFGAAHGIPQVITNELNLCLDELLNNTISYGYEDKDAHDIFMDLILMRGLVTVEVRDDGRPFDPFGAALAIPSGTVQSRKLGGVGVHFVRALVDDLAYARSGQFNVVRISKKLPEAGDGDR